MERLPSQHRSQRQQTHQLRRIVDILYEIWYYKFVKTGEIYRPTEIWHPELAGFEFGKAITTARQAMNNKNPKQLIQELKKAVRRSDNGIMYAVLTGKNDAEYSKTDALVLFNPFANTATANMLVRTEFIREAAQKADIRDEQGKLKTVIMLASPGFYRGSDIKLSKEEKQRVRNGDFGPTARELLKTVAAKDFGRVALLGFSQGADVAVGGATVAYSENLDVNRLGIGDPATNQARGPFELALDFLKTGSSFQRYIEASDLTPQKTAIGKSPLSPPRNMDFVSFGLSSLLVPANRDLWTGLRKDTLQNELQHAVISGSIEKCVVGYGGNSTIATPHTMEPILEKIQKAGNEHLVSIRVAGATHAWGDHLPLLAKLYLRAL